MRNESPLLLLFDDVFSQKMVPVVSSLSRSTWYGDTALGPRIEYGWEEVRHREANLSIPLRSVTTPLALFGTGGKNVAVCLCVSQDVEVVQQWTKNGGGMLPLILQ